MIDFGDFPRFAAAFWTLYDKSGARVPFRLNNAQRLVLAAIQQQRAAGRPVRLRILKFRQAGQSTLANAYTLHRTIINTGWTSISLADKTDLPAQWLRRCRSWLEQLPLRPSTGATNANELWFDRLGSRYYIGSAEGTTPGMGATIQAVHCSEVASWRDPDSVLADLLPAVPPGPDTIVLQESTGRAVGDWWYQRYHEAKRGESGYQAVFLPWHIQDEYRDSDTSDLIDLSVEEQALLRAGLDRHQLAWRRRILRDDFHGDEAAFRNQFPLDDVEAFLAGGANVYTAAQVARARGCIREPIWTGEIIPQADPRQYELIQSKAGRLWVYEQPRPGEHYAIGGDCQWGGRVESDFDAAYVERISDSKVVARWHGKLQLGEWAKTLASIGYRYNTGRLGPERNSLAAQGVILVLLGMTGNGWSYPNLFVRDRMAAFGVARPEDYGWLTTEQTKSTLVTLGMTLLSGGGLDCPDAALCDELAAYVRNEKNQFGAPEGQHDDLLMARLITAEVARQYRAELACDPNVGRGWPDLQAMDPANRRVAEHILESDRRDAEAAWGEQGTW